MSYTDEEVAELKGVLMRAKATMGEWDSVARAALHWRDETRPVQAPPAAVPAGYVLGPVDDLRTKVRAITTHLRNREWADDPGETDPDVIELREQINELIGRVTAARQAEIAAWMLASGDARINRPCGIWVFAVGNSKFSLEHGWAQCMRHVRYRHGKLVDKAERYMAEHPSRLAERIESKERSNG